MERKLLLTIYTLITWLVRCTQMAFALFPLQISLIKLLEEKFIKEEEGFVQLKKAQHGGYRYMDI